MEMYGMYGVRHHRLFGIFPIDQKDGLESACATGVTSGRDVLQHH